MNVIEGRQLTKTYGTGGGQVEALKGVDLTVEKGTMLAIMGPSGSGKSTLLHLIGGIEVPTSGKVLLEGADMASMNDDERTLLRRRRMGFVFQAFNLLPTFTAQENVALPLLLDGISQTEANRRAAEMLDLVKLAGRMHHVPSAMSGGEQQRVAIARALVNEPALILADEPTGNLDSAGGKNVIALLRGLVDRRQQTIVMVTHDPTVAARADRLVSLRDGVIENDEHQYQDASTIEHKEAH